MHHLRLAYYWYWLVLLCWINYFLAVGLLKMSALVVFLKILLYLLGFVIALAISPRIFGSGQLGQWPVLLQNDHFGLYVTFAPIHLSQFLFKVAGPILGHRVLQLIILHCTIAHCLKNYCTISSIQCSAPNHMHKI